MRCPICKEKAGYYNPEYYLAIDNRDCKKCGYWYQTFEDRGFQWSFSKLGATNLIIDYFSNTPNIYQYTIIKTPNEHIEFAGPYFEINFKNYHQVVKKLQLLYLFH